jgi:asparagine synthase (glutamine-hydrolysing)
MCGIFGKIYNNPIENHNKHKFYEALNLLEHRGPDNYGAVFKKTIAFGHRRLSIIDLSDEAKQPFLSSDGLVTIVFNGEIYNFKELRIELSPKYKFKTNSDTEVLLNLYYEYGIECLDKLIGMFSIAIYDKRYDISYLVRDRLGIKPLYYFYYDNEITFSSEIKSILHFENYSFRPNEEAISSYLSFRYPILNDTFFKDIQSLPSGHFIKVKDGNISIHQYWNAANQFKKQKNLKSEDYYIDKLRDLLFSSIKYRMISDVPIGAFLSGGVDSSIITAVMAQESSNPIKTFTIGFEEEGYNEFHYANIVASQYKTDHHEIILSGENYIDKMEELIAFKDAPLSVPNEVPLHMMSQELKKHITVVLSGEGADEIFGGYGRIFRSPYDYERFKELELGDYSDNEKIIFLKNFREKYNSNTFDSELEHFYSLYSYCNIIDKKKLCNNKIINNQYENKMRNIFEGLFNELDNSSYYNKMMYAFEKIHLQGLLNRVDMSTMSTSVEARVPFVDHRLVEFAFSIPIKYKLKWKSQELKIKSKLMMSDKISESHDIPKYLLKKAYEKDLNSKVLYRKKMGFPVPLNNWFGGSFNEYAHEILLDKITIERGQINYKNIYKILSSKDLLDNHSLAMKIWMLINVELFNRKYFD